MTRAVIFKALVIGSLLISTYSTASLADQELSDQKAMEAYDGAPAITAEQQHRWETKMLSWQKNLAEDLQEKIHNQMILKEIIDYQEDVRCFSIELGGAHKRIVQN